MSRIASYLDTLIAKGGQFQIGLRGSPQPIGPGAVEKIADHDGLYQILIEATVQMNKHAKPSPVRLPITFDIVDVVMLIEPPINQDGDGAILTPNGNRTPGGLHIPGA